MLMLHLHIAVLRFGLHTFIYPRSLEDDRLWERDGVYWMDLLPIFRAHPIRMLK